MRQWIISQALDSFRQLVKSLPELTEEEVLAALELESSAQRRKSILDRLIHRAAELRKLHCLSQLKEKHYGP